MRSLRLAGLVLFSPALALAVPFFVDDLNTVGSAANYNVVFTDTTTSTATFAYDYSAMGIPSAPNSGDGSTLGLRLAVNISASTSAEAITVFTKTIYSGASEISFDAWLNVNGPFPEGGVGSTNYLTTGVGGDGTTLNLVNNTGSGGWTAVDGENGSGIDYRLYKDGVLQAVETNQYAAGNALDARSGANAYYSQFGNIDVSNFPVQGVNNGGPEQQNGTSFVGSFGMAWHRVRLVLDPTGGTAGAASVQWYIDNLLIGTLDAGANGGFNSNGYFSFGYADPTANSPDNPSLSFALIDNVSIVPEPSVAALGLLGLAAFAFRRRTHRR